ncbi:MAG: hypothetical protein AAF918_15490 [Pseudomonadota bacterium]
MIGSCLASAAWADPKPLTWEQIEKLEWLFVHSSRPELKSLDDLASPTAELAQHMLDQNRAQTCFYQGKQVDSVAQRSALWLETLLGQGVNWFRKKGFAPPKRLPLAPENLSNAAKGFATTNSVLVAGCKAAGTYGVHYRCTGQEHANDNNAIAFGSGVNAMFDPASGSLAYIGAAAAHELGHVFTAGAMEGQLRCAQTKTVGGDWVTEGIADALMLDFVDETFEDSEVYRRGVENRFEARFYLHRPAYRPLDWYPLNGPASIADHDAKNIEYAAGSFWLHVMRRHMNDQYNPLATVVREVHKDKGIAYVDEWLDSIDGKLAGLESIFPQYVAELAQYHKWKFNGRLNREKAHKLAFNGCERISASTTDSGGLTLSLAPYSARCVEIVPSSNRGLPFSLSIRTSRSDMAIDDVYLSLAELSGLNTKFDCFQSAQENADAPCLMKPIQFEGNGGVFYRDYHLTDQLAIYDETPLVRVIVSYVPKTMEKTPQDYSDRIIRVNFAAAVSSVSLNDKPASTEESWGGRELAHATYMGGEIASSMVGALGTSVPGIVWGDLNDGSAIETASKLTGFVLRLTTEKSISAGIGGADIGMANGIGSGSWSPGALKSAGIGDHLLISLLKGQSIKAGSVTRDRPLKIEARGTMNNTRYVRLHNRYKSTGALRIIESNKYRIRFAGSVSACEHPPGFEPLNQPRRLTFRGLGKKYVYDANGRCQTETEDFEFTGSIAWPNYRAFGNDMKLTFTENVLRLYQIGGSARPGPMYGPWSNDRGKPMSIFSTMPRRQKRPSLLDLLRSRTTSGLTPSTLLPAGGVVLKQSAVVEQPTAFQ